MGFQRSKSIAIYSNGGHHHHATDEHSYSQSGQQLIDEIRPARGGVEEDHVTEKGSTTAEKKGRAT